jgi:hypothetical protein
MHLRNVNSQQNRKDRELPVGREDAINRLNYGVKTAEARLACSWGVLHRPLAGRQCWPGTCAKPFCCMSPESGRTSPSAVILWAPVRKFQRKYLRQRHTPLLHLHRCEKKEWEWETRGAQSGKCLIQLENLLYMLNPRSANHVPIASDDTKIFRSHMAILNERWEMPNTKCPRNHLHTEDDKKGGKFSTSPSQCLRRSKSCSVGIKKQGLSVVLSQRMCWQQTTTKWRSTTSC